MYERASFHVEARRSVGARELQPPLIDAEVAEHSRRARRTWRGRGATSESMPTPKSFLWVVDGEEGCPGAPIATRTAVLRDLAVYSAASASISCSSRRASTWNSLLVQPLHRRPGNPNPSIVPRTLILLLLALASPVVSP